MRRRRHILRPAALAVLVALLASSIASHAHAQACCAGTGAVTPGRLGVYDTALVGLQLRAAEVLGLYGNDGHYAKYPSNASELDLEQDLFGSLRVLGRGQVSLLVPLVETHRSAGPLGETSGGIGDVNLSARYDFFHAGEKDWVPGLALLAGVTLPTGTPVEAATKPLATDATGVGAFQGNLGVALEQTLGSWLVNGTVLVAKRAGRTVGDGAATVHAELGAQWTLLAALGYTFSNDAALAVVASYALENEGTLNGAPTPSKRTPVVSLSGLWPFGPSWRLQGGFFLNPPFSQIGKSDLSLLGTTLTLLRTWS